MPAIFLTSPAQAENARSLRDTTLTSGELSSGLVVFLGKEDSEKLEILARRIFPNAKAFLRQRDWNDILDFSRHSPPQLRLYEALLFFTELVPEILGSRLLSLIFKGIGGGNPGPVVIGWPGARLASLLSMLAPKRNGLYIVDDGLESVAFALDRFRYLTGQFYGKPSRIFRGGQAIHFYSKFPLVVHDPDKLSQQPITLRKSAIREKKQTIWIVGSPTPKLYGLDPSPYLEWVRRVCREASVESKDILYLPHRREDRDLVSKIKRFSDNVSISDSENFEILARRSDPPAKLTGIVSTVHFTAARIFPESTVIECVVPVSWWKTRPTAFTEALLQLVSPVGRVRFVRNQPEDSNKDA